MKLKKLLAVGLVASCLSISANAALDSVLTGMYINASAPDSTSSQFRGTLSGGSMYLRTPITNLQVFSLDPPRFSSGCGGIDLYLGSFSYISSAKLTQFFRSVAQNAIPLLFQMAVGQLFPQLDAAVKKFQQIAQDMGKQQKDSCTMAHGLVDGMKNPSAALADMQNGIDAAITTAKGWATDFADAAVQAVTSPSAAATQVLASKTPTGTPTSPESGNITWNALALRTWNGQLLNLADTEKNGKQIVMSLVGTEVRDAGSSATADPVTKPFGPLLRLTQLVAPETDTTGVVGVPIYSCGTDVASCMTPSAATLSTYGIKGFVTLNMLGSRTAVAPQAGSIIYQIANCNAPSCSLTAGQLAFLNSIAKVPAIALLMSAQRNPNILGILAPRLIDEMVNEVAVLYAGAVITQVSNLYSGTQTPKPESFDAGMKNMLDDLRVMQDRTSKSVESLNSMMTFIDASNRSLGGALNYRPKR